MRLVSLASLCLLLVACGGGATPTGDAGSDAAAIDASPLDAATIDAATLDAGPPDAGTSVCDSLGLPARPFATGPYGYHRGELADDLVVDQADGTTWSLRASWTGCESVVFVPDSLRQNALDPTLVWESDLGALVGASPRNAHYVLVSTNASATDAATNVTAMQGRVSALLATLSTDDAAHWRAHLHVLAHRAGELGNWLDDALAGPGRDGLAIDRAQRIRGLGSLADVHRFEMRLSDASVWPWNASLAYAANEVLYFDAQAEERARLEAETATVVPLWNGEVLMEYAETDATLPSAAVMASFDTLEVEVESGCPDAEAPETGNCGAWDYVARLSVLDPTAGLIEIARFVTSYHRETHWVVDVSPMLVHLLAGGARHFRWDFAPSWNTQPTATRVSLRLSSRGRADRPFAAQFLWSGGDLGSTYDAMHPMITAVVPADATRTELVAILTGHGSGVGQCAEFCDHQHEITIGGTTYRRTQPEAGTDDGCMAHLTNGMVPNQAGTWWFGRGGWCPGQQVDLWVEDVSASVTPGAMVSLTYHALVGGAPPPDGSGNVDLVSYLVFYR